MDEPKDISIPCADPKCNSVRIFTPGEQAFFESRGFQRPKYCKVHSAKRRAEREQPEHSDRGEGPRIPGMESDRDLLS